jgi:NAD(P)H-hydrate repair Nnr-like enzyme with NAD(P)H-hydrate epimerase domain
MISAYSGTAVRAAEKPLLAAGDGPALMQRAAYGLYAACVRELLAGRGSLYGARVTVLAGAGNNGGDALYAAARLARRGAGITAVLTAPAAHPEALAPPCAPRQTCSLTESSAPVAGEDCAGMPQNWPSTWSPRGRR